jgi:RND family efflux transporter MFP subunit
MKKNIISILILIALVVLIVLKLKENKQEAEARVYHYNREQPILIQSQKVSAKPLNINRDLTGNFMPEKDGRVNADVQGKVISIRVKEGDYVKKGKLLIKLDPTLLQSKKRALDVKIKGFQDDVKRYEVLVKANALPAVKLEKAQLGLRAAIAERRGVIDQINKTNIYAPFSGYVTMKMTEVGSFAAPGMPLLQLTDINKLQFTVNISEGDLDLFDMNKEYEIAVDALPGTIVKGKLSMIGSKANRANEYPVKFDVKNKKNSIKSGMFGTVKINKNFGDNVIIIPATVVRGSENNPQVYVIQNGKAVLKNIVITKRIDNSVVVKEGLKQGDEIVSAGFVNLFDGANVTTK